MNGLKDFINDHFGAFIIVGCFCLFGFLVWVCVELDKVSCNQKQEFAPLVNHTYEYHFPNGCMIITNKENS